MKLNTLYLMEGGRCMEKLLYKNKMNFLPKMTGYTYQLEAVNAVKELDYSAVFHEQGLGKTKIAIDVMLYWLQNKKVDTVLFVTKRGLVTNWKEELEKHTYFKVKTLSNDQNSNYYVLNSSSRVILTHYEVLNKEKNRFKKYYLKSRNVGIVLDESQKIKNPDSKLTQTYFELSSYFKKKIIMTGTPIANRPYDIWAQIYFLDKGVSLGENFKEFKEEVDLSNKLNKNDFLQNTFESNMREIYAKIQHLMVRETKDSGIITLPKKVYKNILCEMENMQADLYRSILQDLVVDIVKDGVELTDDNSELLKRLLRLIQVASNPIVMNDNYSNIPGKVNELDRIIDEVVSSQEKVIIWTSFVKNVHELSLRYRKYGAVTITGQIDSEVKDMNVRSFKTDENCKVLIATPMSAKEGLTLTVANHTVFYDRSLSLDDYLQAQDRIHRISQTKTCYIYNLIAKNSIDIWVDELLKSKHLAAQLGQGDISFEYFKENMSYSFGEIVKSILEGEYV